MAKKLKPLSIGLTLGSMLAILYAIRTIVLFFAGFVLGTLFALVYNKFNK